jgi:hypothetical protein
MWLGVQPDIDFCIASRLMVFLHPLFQKDLMMYSLRSFLSAFCLALLAWLLGGPSPQLYAQGTPNAQIFLPLVSGGAGQPVETPQQTSIQLIEQAVLAGQLTEEQGLVYRVQAVVGDPALPARYLGNDAGLDGSTVMAEAVANFETFSAATQAQLRPYLLPPSAEGSWLGQQAGAAGLASATQEWDHVATANGKVKVWYRTATASHGARAVAIARAIDQKIWPELTKWMREPLPDCGATCAAGGGDNRIDIYLTNVRRSYTQPFTCCSGSSGFAIMRADASFPYIARALMYIIQFSYPIDSLAEYRWLMHASAQFAMEYVYPSANEDPDYPARNEEHAKADDFLYRTLYPLETVDDGHEFGAYLLFYWLDDPSAVPDVWNSATNPDSLAVINDQINQGLHWGWPRFAVDNWNREPVDFYRRHDQLTIGTETVEDIEMGSPGTEEFVIDIPHLTSYYFRFTFPDKSLKRISVFNPIAGAGEPTGALWAIMKIDGTWRAPQDWSDRSHEFFCRDEPNQNLEELILVLANSEWEDRQHVVKTEDGSIRVSPDCGGMLTGTFTMHDTAQAQMPSGARGNHERTTVVNVRLRYDEEREAYVDAGSSFSHSGQVYAEGRSTTTGELGYIIEYTESGSGEFTQDGTQIKGSVALRDEPGTQDETWIGATIRLRKTGTTTYYPNEFVVPIDGEETMTLICNDPTGVRGLRTENGAFDMTCTAEWSSDTGSGRLTVSGTLNLQ